jgi:hypothetical protein
MEREWMRQGGETATKSAWRGGSHRDGGGGWMTEGGRQGVNWDDWAATPIGQLGRSEAVGPRRLP